MKNNCLGSCAIGATFHLSENIERKNEMSINKNISIGLITKNNLNYILLNYVQYLILLNF